MTDSDRLMLATWALFLCAQMIVAGFATADDLVDEVKDIGPWSLEIREECKVVRQIVEGVDYVVCAEESGITWREVRE